MSISLFYIVKLYYKYNARSKKHNLRHVCSFSLKNFKD